MIVTVFRSRLNPETETEYKNVAMRMAELSKTMPGYVSHKTFFADDGERVTIVEFESEDDMDVWSKHPEHLEAKKAGRELFFTEFKIHVCDVKRTIKKDAAAQS